MAFRFNLSGIECQCDTADELRSAVLNGSALKPKRAKPRRAKATNGQDPAKAGEETAAGMPPIADLPLIDGPLAWPVVQKAMKKIGFKGDQRAFRSALKRRQEMVQA